MKKQKYSVAAGIVLFILAAIFSVSLLSAVIDFGSLDPMKSTFFHSMGKLFTGVYGICSVFIPVFLIAAGIQCFNSNWRIRNGVLLLGSVVPFFTADAIEHICRMLLKSEADSVLIVKMSMTLLIGGMILAAEYLLLSILGDVLENSLAESREYSEYYEMDDENSSAQDEENESEEYDDEILVEEDEVKPEKEKSQEAGDGAFDLKNDKIFLEQKEVLKDLINDGKEEKSQEELPEVVEMDESQGEPDIIGEEEVSPENDDDATIVEEEVSPFDHVFDIQEKNNEAVQRTLMAKEGLEEDIPEERGEEPLIQDIAIPDEEDSFQDLMEKKTAAEEQNEAEKGESALAEAAIPAEEKESDLEETAASAEEENALAEAAIPAEEKESDLEETAASAEEESALAEAAIPTEEEESDLEETAASAEEENAFAEAAIPAEEKESDLEETASPVEEEKIFEEEEIPVSEEDFKSENDEMDDVEPVPLDEFGYDERSKNENPADYINIEDISEEKADSEESFSDDDEENLSIEDIFSQMEEDAAINPVFKNQEDEEKKENFQENLEEARDDFEDDEALENREVIEENELEENDFEEPEFDDNEFEDKELDDTSEESDETLYDSEDFTEPEFSDDNFEAEELEDEDEIENQIDEINDINFDEEEIAAPDSVSEEEIALAQVREAEEGQKKEEKPLRRLTSMTSLRICSKFMKIMNIGW